MQIDTLTIVGVGLIGGSIGLAAKRRGLARCVRGVGRNPVSIDKARALGAIDEGSEDLRSAGRDAQVIIFCTPVDRIAEQALAVAPSCSPGTLLTDAGSTKAAIVRALDGQLPNQVSYVGSHPLAGSEKRGVEHADAKLFEKRLTLVTPTPRTDANALERTCGLWQALGSRVRVMDAEEHDRALAFTSHVPHLIAAALAGALPAELAELTATGFRDTTRVAAGDPELWSAIFAANRDAVLEALRPVTARLEDFRLALEAGDWNAVDTLLAQARKVRDALGN
jgi:cyclohexadieny/prephenate dehydrogenase